MAGMHGVAWANLAVQNADLLIALGMRMDDRFTGSLRMFAPHAKVVHIDIDPAEIGKRVPVTVPIVGDVKLVLQAILAEVPAIAHDDWIAEINEWRETHPLLCGEGNLPPQQVIRTLSSVTRGEANIVSDVGQHQMWVAQHYDFQKPNHFFTSGGLGTMGYSVPAAMGIQAGRRQEEGWVVCGDGSFQMNLQELATIVQESLPIKIVILNNGYLGMVRQWQELFHDARYVATPISSPDFVSLAASYGIQGQRVDKLADLEKAFNAARRCKGPFVLDCRVEAGENVYPMVPPGAGNADFRLDPRHNGEK
jgi:acetolactate synthase-1/2/3 large subunit